MQIKFCSKLNTELLSRRAARFQGGNQINDLSMGNAYSGFAMLSCCLVAKKIDEKDILGRKKCWIKKCLEEKSLG